MYRLFATSIALFTAAGTVIADDLVPYAVIEHLGLNQAWARPVTAPWGAQSISHQKLVVMESDPVEYVEIVKVVPGDAAPANGDASAKPPVSDPNVLVRMRTEQLQANGQPMGRQEAERVANNEIRRLKRRGIEAKVRVRTLPRVNLFSISNDGTLECRDAETGEPIWMVRVGDQNLPFMSLGADEENLIVVNGSNFYHVDSVNGEVISQVPTIGAPSFGATIAGDFVMIPMIGGGIECYPLRDATIDPFLEKVNGSALALPVRAPDVGSSRTAWGTDSGFVYVMEMQGVPSLLFRLKTDGIVSGRIASAKGNRFFFGSEGGQVYGIRASRSGEVLWSQPIGEPFYNEPIVFGDQVLLRSAYGNLFSLRADTGQMSWSRPVTGVGELMGVIDGRLYITTLSGHCRVLDLESGQMVASPQDLRPADFITNTLTNRLYLVGSDGDIQCLHAKGEDLPTFHHEVVVAEKSDGAAANSAKQNPNATNNAGGNDPFGAGGNDPFGAGMNDGKDPFGAGGNDPFGGGGGNDPFGGGDGGGMDDPFGGSNPFGN